METTIQKGNLLGGILLVAGCCIGAGMLGLPVLSAMAGFIPSVVMFVICWAFMVSTGLLLLEVNLWFGQNISIITMAERTLGGVGKAVSWFVFLFLFYSLMVAYVAASGSLVTNLTEQIFHYSLYPGIGSVLFCLLFGFLIYLGIGAVDWFNRILMVGLILTYICLIVMGIPHIQTELLKHQDWSTATLVLPAVIVSFGFHNLIPSLTTYFNGNRTKLVQAIVMGSVIPLVIYLVWEYLILGIVSLGDFKEALDKGEIATGALKDAVGASWILDVAQGFAFFAIITSFLSVAISFVDFLADGLGIQKTPLGKILLATLVLVPPLICSALYPSIFLLALNYAGGFGAVILFGILPALMVWKGRYTKKLALPQMIPGGKPFLIGIIVFSFWIMALQLI
jgi:tyrosine-specific transport protein